MKKFPIGFNTKIKDGSALDAAAPVYTDKNAPRKSVVRVYFPSRGMTLAYYNDKFDLKPGDLVYVDGKLEGKRGRVVDVNYSFKIKLSDYKRVIAVADTSVSGRFRIAGSHLITFDEGAVPFEKVLAWFKAPEDDEDYAVGSDDGEGFPLDDLSQMNIAPEIADRGHNYYLENKVSCLSLDGTRGSAVVEGTEPYEVAFDYYNGQISNLTCSCFCSYNCKHEFAVMLQLREILDFITKNCGDEYCGYFAAISKETFMNIVMSRNGNGIINLEV